MHAWEVRIDPVWVPSHHRSFVEVAEGLQLGIAAPAIRAHDAAGLDCLEDERFQAGGRSVGHALEPDAPDPGSSLLRSHCDQGLLPKLLSRCPACLAVNVDLVHFDPPSQPVPSRTHHGASQLVQPGPPSLVLPQAQDPLQSQCADVVLLSRHPPDQRS